jgi:hypothetical protein
MIVRSSTTATREVGAPEESSGVGVCNGVDMGSAKALPARRGVIGFDESDHLRQCIVKKDHF